MREKMKAQGHLRSYLYILAIILFVVSAFYNKGAYSLIIIWTIIPWIALDLLATPTSKYPRLAAIGKWLDKPRFGKH